jgi:hypothetical protein
VTEPDGEYDMTPEEIDAFYRRQSRAVRHVGTGFGIFGVVAIVLSLTIPALHLGIWVGVLAVWVGTVLFFINAFRHWA